MVLLLLMLKSLWFAESTITEKRGEPWPGRVATGLLFNGCCIDESMHMMYSYVFLVQHRFINNMFK